MKKIILAAGGTAGALLAVVGAWNLLWDTLPPSMRPATEAWHSGRSDVNDIADAEQSIKYQHQNRCDLLGYDPEALADASALYFELKGRLHHYQSISRDEVCEDITLRRQLRRAAKERDYAETD